MLQAEHLHTHTHVLWGAKRMRSAIRRARTNGRDAMKAPCASCCLVWQLCNPVLQPLSDAPDNHIQGVAHGAHEGRRLGILTPQLARKLQKVDNCFQIVRHIIHASASQPALDTRVSLGSAREVEGMAQVDFALHEQALRLRPRHRLGTSRTSKLARSARRA